MSYRNKWVTEPDEYVCRLPAELQELAREELREDDYTRRQSLRNLREWLDKNQRIERCRYDSNFLLRFLRFKKFSLPAAQEALERFLLLRQSFAKAFANLDMNLPLMREMIDRGLAVPIPGRDYLGRRVIIGRGREFDPYRYTAEDACRLAAIFCETLLMDEETQIRGLVYFGDGRGIGFPHLTLLTPREAVRLVKNGEKTIPVRHKEAHAVHCHPSLKFVVDWGFSLVSEKYKKRIKIYSNMDELNENIDKNLLPKEYGGKMPISEMIDLWKKELESSRRNCKLNDQMSVNLNMYTDKAKIGAVSVLKQGYCCKSDQSMGLVGSFKKLEVD